MNGLVRPSKFISFQEDIHLLEVVRSYLNSVWVRFSLGSAAGFHSVCTCDTIDVRLASRNRVPPTFSFNTGRIHFIFGMKVVPMEKVCRD